MWLQANEPLSLHIHSMCFPVVLMLSVLAQPDPIVYCQTIYSGEFNQPGVGIFVGSEMNRRGDMQVCNAYAKALNEIANVGNLRGLSCVNRGYNMVGLSGGYATTDAASPCDAVATALNAIADARVRSFFPFFLFSFFFFLFSSSTSLSLCVSLSQPPRFHPVHPASFKIQSFLCI